MWALEDSLDILKFSTNCSLNILIIYFLTKKMRVSYAWELYHFGTVRGVLWNGLYGDGEKLSSPRASFFFVIFYVLDFRIIRFRQQNFSFSFLAIHRLPMSNLPLRCCSVTPDVFSIYTYSLFRSFSNHDILIWSFDSGHDKVLLSCTTLRFKALS